MTSCAGCNHTLGWKKYNFQKQWKIPGYFCKECMMKISQDFDDHGKITIPKKQCDSCHLEFYFLKPIKYDKKQKLCCTICKDLDFSKISNVETIRQRPVPPRIPIMMAIFAAFGILLMFSGFVYVVMVAPQQDSGILHVILGSTMSGAGFMLARKMIKVRNIILGKDSIGLKVK